MPSGRTPAQALERRALLLGQEIKRRVGILAAGLAPPGSGPPFSERMGSDKALGFWLSRRYAPEYAGYLQAMEQAKPGSLAGLDAALSRYATEQQQGASTASPSDQELPPWP